MKTLKEFLNEKKSAYFGKDILIALLDSKSKYIFEFYFDEGYETEWDLSSLLDKNVLDWFIDDYCCDVICVKIDYSKQL